MDENINKLKIKYEADKCNKLSYDKIEKFNFSFNKEEMKQNIMLNKFGLVTYRIEFNNAKIILMPCCIQLIVEYNNYHFRYNITKIKYEFIKIINVFNLINNNLLFDKINTKILLLKNIIPHNDIYTYMLSYLSNLYKYDPDFIIELFFEQNVRCFIS